MTNSIFSADGQFAGVTLDKFQIRPGWNIDDLRCDLETLRRSCARSTNDETSKEVAQLMMRTKLREYVDGEGQLLAETITNDLKAYPIDVVKFACAYWIEGGAANKFFPSWPELKEICDRRVSGRIRLGKAVASLIAEAEKAPAA